MATECKRDTSDKLIWTFIIEGGTSFKGGSPLTPILEHTGGRTLWKMFGTEEESLAAKQFIELHSGALVLIRAERQTTEQQEERKHG